MITYSESYLKELELESAIKFAEEKAEEKAEAKGMEKEKKEIARNLLKMGISVESIAKATDLDIEFIKSLK